MLTPPARSYVREVGTGTFLEPLLLVAAVQHHLRVLVLIGTYLSSFGQVLVFTFFRLTSELPCSYLIAAFLTLHSVHFSHFIAKLVSIFFLSYPVLRFFIRRPFSVARVSFCFLQIHIFPAVVCHVLPDLPLVTVSV